MNKKREMIVSVLYLLGKVWGRTFLQKFFYLLNRERYNQELFEYEFYKYGPFCDEINEELTDLEIEGDVDETAELTKGFNTSYTYELTKKGKESAQEIFNNKLSNEDRNNLIEYVNKFRDYTPTELLKYVYEKYPEVTENSEFEN